MKILLCLGLGLGVAAAADAGPVEEAERLAAEARSLAGSDPAAAAARARQALERTGEFEPTAFVSAGRKGEVVEDAFVAAREAYRRHRAGLYLALGEALAAGERPAAAARYLRRALLLDRGSGAALPLARALVEQGRGREALEAIAIERPGALSAAARTVVQAAADAARLPSLQAEVDRRRLAALDVEPAVEFRHGPFELAHGTRLSTGSSFSLDQDELTLFYVADDTCRSCSADLETIARLVRSDQVRVVMAPADPEEDYALRQAVQVYRYPWPFLVRSRFVQEQKLPAPSVFMVARRGWVGAVVRRPFPQTLPPALDALLQRDVEETVPRPRWNRRPVPPWEPAPAPAVLPEGLLPGEDEPFPAEFEAALAAYRAGRYGEALELFETLAARGDGWLLPPEARLNRALCLAGQGKRKAAREMLLRIGDARDQDAVDRALEQSGGSGGGR